MILLKNLMMNENLSEYEKELVYGNLLESIDDIVLMNEADANREQRLALNQSGDAFKNASKALNGIDKAEFVSTGNKLKYIAAQNWKKAREQEKKDAISGERLREATDLSNNQILAAEKTLENTQEKKKNTLERLNQQEKNIVRQLNNDIEQKQKRVELFKQKNKFKNQISTTADKTEVSSANEQYSFLFKNDDGKILEHFINNTPLTDYKLSKLASLMESDESVNNIVKKINYYYNKPELCYESYIDMKVQRGKFKEKYYSLKK